MSFLSSSQKQAIAPFQKGQAQDSAPRLIASQQGYVLYHNDGFLNIYGENQSLVGLHISSLFFWGDDHNLPDNGEYIVNCPHNNKNLSLQFDWITTQSGESFLVASAEKFTAAEKLRQYVDEKISSKAEIQHDPSVFSSMSFDLQAIMDSNGRFTTINNNFTDILGFRPEDLSHKSFIDIVHPEEKAQVLNFLKGLRDNPAYPGPVYFTACSTGKNGEMLEIEWHMQSAGEKIYAAGRDLTLLKIYQEQFDQQQRRLEEAEAIGNIGQWHWKIGTDVIEFSKQLYKIFGVEKNNFSPTLDSVISMIHNNDADRMMQIFQRAIIEQKDYEIDFRLNHPDGTIRYIRCEGRCKIDADRDVVALYGIMQDISDTMQRETDLKKAKDSVERAYAAKTRFLANMSHELRTPLNAVIGFSEMMERQLLGPIGNDKYLEYIKGIRESGEHLLDLISDILDMSKIEAGKYELNLETFNLNKVIRLACHMMEGRALDDNIKLKTNLPGEDVTVIADRRAVMQMILNLLSNAIKFSKKEGLVEISLLKREYYCSIKVKDQGIGIPANKLANITLPFEQAETEYSRQYEGTGLGLAITKELAEIHGGSLNIESEVNVGTIVTIRLPYEAKKASHH